MDTPRSPVTAHAVSPAGPAARPRGAILVRLGWMFAGSLVMLISVMTIASLPSWTLSLRDGVFWAAVVGTGALRYWDASRLGGETTSGERTTPAVLHRYLGGLAAFAVVAWVAAQSVQL